VDGSLKARTLFEEEPQATSFPQEKPFLAKEYKRIAENQSVPQTHHGPWLPARMQQNDQTPSPPFSRRSYQQRFNQEHVITMSKMSLFGLIAGLMLLGVLFFMIGFLVALGTLEPPKPPAAPPPSSWGDMSSSPGTASQGPQAQKSVFANMAKQQLSQGSSAAMKFVPKPLQSVAQPLKSQGTGAVQDTIVGKKTSGAASQQPQPTLQQPSGALPGGLPQMQGGQQPLPQQQQQQAYMPPPVSNYAPPPPPVAYAPPPYAHY